MSQEFEQLKNHIPTTYGRLCYAAEISIHIVLPRDLDKTELDTFAYCVVKSDSTGCSKLGAGSVLELR